MNRLIALGFACILGLAVIVPAFAPGAASAAEIALVIGNRDYKRAPDVRNAETDARAVAAALEDGGYDVSLGINMSRREMRSMLQRFAGKIRSGDKAVIYYSGHALRSDGVTYLAPVEQRNGTLVQVMMDGVPLELVLRVAEAGRAAAVFIDAAQLEGFTPNAISEPGLASISPGRGVLVVSAAAPGRAIPRRGSRGSAFAREVVSDFLSPGARAMAAARNMRAPAWSAGSVRERLRLVTRRGARTGSGTGSGAAAPTADSPATVEAALRLSRAQKRDIQESLTLLGHDPRGIDGAFGPATRTAIRLWQRANNLAETGYMDSDQVALLERQSRDAGSVPASRDDTDWARADRVRTADAYRSYLERHSDGRHAGDARARLKQIARAGTDPAARRERDDWRFAKDGGRLRDYRDYVDRYPTGIWLPEAQARIAELPGTPTRQPAAVDPVAEETALALTRNDRLSIEQRLNYLGFSPGIQDGFFDSNARRAIGSYQRSRGFGPTGYVDQPTIARLLDETAGVTQGIIIDGAAVLRNLLGGGLQ